MNLLRLAGRVCTGSVYVYAGSKTAQKPAPSAAKAKRVLGAARRVVPLPASDQQLVQVNGGLQVVAGGALALGIFPRLSAATLACSLIPTTAAGHAFWEIENPTQRAAQQLQFVKNLSMLGGLLYIAGSKA